MRAATTDSLNYTKWAEHVIKENHPELLAALPGLFKKLEIMKHQISETPTRGVCELGENERQILNMLISELFEKEYLANKINREGKRKFELSPHDSELFGGGHCNQWATKISNGHDFVQGSGITTEKSQEAASKKWAYGKTSERFQKKVSDPADAPKDKTDEKISTIILHAAAHLSRIIDLMNLLNWPKI